MKEPSEARKRTLALQERAIRFSTAVNRCCPHSFPNVPSSVVWNQLIRAADSTSNNLVEAEGASSDADFLSKMRISLREAKESRTCLRKVSLGQLAGAQSIGELNLESEADQLAAIFATIIIKMERRLAVSNAAFRKRKI